MAQLCQAPTQDMQVLLDPATRESSHVWLLNESFASDPSRTYSAGIEASASSAYVAGQAGEEHLWRPARKSTRLLTDSVALSQALQRTMRRSLPGSEWKTQSNDVGRMRRWATQLERSWPAVDPRTNTCLLVWDCILIFVTIIVVILAPVEASFDLEDNRLAVFSLHCNGFSRVTTAIFVADMCLQALFVAYPDPERSGSVMVASPCAILKHYMTGMFLVDLLAVSPDLIMRPCLSAQWPTVCRVSRVLRLLRLLQVASRIKLVQITQVYFGYSLAFMELAKFIIVVSFTCHCMACLFGAMAFNYSDYTWMVHLKEAVSGDKDELRDPFNIYLISIYWAIQTLTTVGYGDIPPVRVREYIVCSICMSGAAMLWAHTIGEICRIVANIDRHSVAFSQKMDDLNRMMRSRNVPHDMQRNIRRFVYEAHDLEIQLSHTPIVDHLSPMLQGEMAILLHGSWMRQVASFGDSADDLLGKVVVHLSRRLLTMHLAPSEELATVRAIYCMRKGVVARRAKILVSGDNWGEDMVLDNPLLRDEAPVRAVTYSQIVMLRHVDFVEVVSASPEVLKLTRRAHARVVLKRGFPCASRLVQDLAYRLGLSELEDVAGSVELRKALFRAVNDALLGNTSYMVDHDGVAQEVKVDKDLSGSTVLVKPSTVYVHSALRSVFDLETVAKAAGERGTTARRRALSCDASKPPPLLNSEQALTNEDAAGKQKAESPWPGKWTNVSSPRDEKERHGDPEVGLLMVHVKELTRLVKELHEKVDAQTSRETPENAFRVY